MAARIAARDTPRTATAARWRGATDGARVPKLERKPLAEIASWFEEDTKRLTRRKEACALGVLRGYPRAVCSRAVASILQSRWGFLVGPLVLVLVLVGVVLGWRG